MPAPVIGNLNMLFVFAHVRPCVRSCSLMCSLMFAHVFICVRSCSWAALVFKCVKISYARSELIPSPHYWRQFNFFKTGISYPRSQFHWEIRQKFNMGDRQEKGS